MALTKLTKRNIIGKWYLHRFKKPDGTIFEVECPQKEYEALALKDAGQPTHKDGTWVISRSGAKFDSPDGHLGKLEYYTKADRHFIVDNDGNYYWGELSDITNDEVDFSKIK